MRSSTLSGGNQQKVVIAKWLMTEPRIILLNDPTRGIDVGTKQELYRLMRELADQGAAILFYSTDYDELIGCCDRVAIMYDGRIVRELEGDEHHRDQHRRQRAQHRRRCRPRRAGRRGPCSDDLAHRLRQNLGLAHRASCSSWSSTSSTTSPHPKGFSSAVLVQNSNEIFALAHGRDGADRAGADAAASTSRSAP